MDRAAAGRILVTFPGKIWRVWGLIFTSNRTSVL